MQKKSNIIMPKDPVCAILTIPTHASARAQKLPEFLESFQFPLIRSEIVQSFEESLQSADFEESVQKHIKTDLPFNQDCLRQCCECLGDGSCEIESVGSFILRSSVAFLQKFMNTGDASAFGLVLSSLAKCKASECYKSLATDMICFVVRFVGTKGDDGVFEDISSGVIEYLGMERDESEDEKVVNCLIDWFCSIPCEGEEMSKSGLCVLEVLAGIGRCCDGVLKSEAMERVMGIAVPFVLKQSSNSFDVLRLLVDVIDGPRKERVYLDVVRAIKKGIEEGDVVLEKVVASGPLVEYKRSKTSMFHGVNNPPLPSEFVAKVESIVQDEPAVVDGQKVLAERLAKACVSKDAQAILVKVMGQVVGEAGDGEHALDVLAFSALVLDSFCPSPAIGAFLQAQFKSQLFDARVSLRDKDVVPSLLLRNVIYRHVLNNVEFCFENILTNVMSYPQIIYEILAYVNFHVDVLKQASISALDKLFESLAKVCMSYSSFDNQDDAVIPYFQLVRQALASVVQTCLNAHEISVRMFASDLFVPAFLTCFGFDSQTKQFAIDCFVKAERDGVSMSESLFATLPIALVSSKGPTTDVWSDFLVMMTDMVKRDISLITTDPQLVVNLSAYLDSLDRESITNCLMLQVAQFFVPVSKCCPISEITAQSLSKAMKARPIANDDPSEQLSSAMQDVVTSGTEMIKQPYMCTALVSAFLQSPLLLNQIVFLTNLCGQSEENCRACHRSKLDVFLLKQLKHKRSEVCDAFVVSTLRLVILIAHVSSSMQVVCKYMSLFTPIGTTELTRYHYTFVDSLMLMGSDSQERNSMFIPLCGGSTFIRASGLKSDLFDHVVSFSIIISETGQQAMDLISFSDANGNKLEIYIDMYNVFHVDVQIGSDKSRSIAKIPFPLGFCRIDVSVEPMSQASCHVHVGVNKRGIDDKPVIIPRPSFCGDLTMMICNSPRCSEFRFYEMQLEIHGHPVLRSHVGVNNGKTELVSSGTCHAEVVGDYETEMSFVDVVTSICSLEIMLPLLAQLSIPIHCNIASHSAAKLVSLLRTFILVSEKAEDKFCLGGGFPTLGFLLSEIPKEYLTWDLFKENMKLFKRLKSNKSKRELFRFVLMNLSVWAEADLETLVAVSKCWNETLYGGFIPDSQELYPFKDLIFSLTSFFNISKFPAGDTRIHSVRQNIIAVAAQAYKKDVFNDVDFGVVLGQCLMATDFSDRWDLLVMIKKLILENQKLNVKAWDDIADLHHLLVDPNDDIVFLVLDIFLALHQMGFFNKSGMDLQLHACILVDFLVTKRSATFMARLIELAKWHNEFLVLCFHMIMISGEEEQQLAMSQLSSSTKISRESMVRLVLCYLSSTGEFRTFLEKYALEGQAFNLKQIACYVRVCAECQKLDERKELTAFIKTSLDLLPSLGNREVFTKEIVEVMLYTILYQSSEYTRPGFDCFFKIFTKTKSESPHKRFAWLEKLLSKERLMRFGLHFDADGNWDDVDLAITCTKLITGNKLSAYYNVAIVLGYFLKNHDKDIGYMEPLFQRAPWALKALINRIESEPMNSNEWYAHVEQDMDNLTKEFEGYLSDTITVCKTAILTKRGINKLFSRREGDGLGATAVARRESEQFKQRVETDKHNSRRQWFHLWNHLAFDGPWKCKVSSGTYTRHWKRDSTLCHCGYPVKLKINNNFDDHMFASLIRDTGSNEKAETLHRKAREEQAGSGLPELLQLVDDKGKTDVESISENATKMLFDCKIIIRKIDENKPGVFRLYANRIQVILNETNRTFTIEPSSISMILARGIVHKPMGMEIFKHAGPSILLEFQQNVPPILKRISELRAFSGIEIQTLPSIQYIKTTKLTSRWVNRKISTFEYLMQLNMMSGRTFKDASMYPVFPWIVKDYESETLDLDSEATFRDLSRPMGTLSAERLESLKTRCLPPDEDIKGRYLYSSCYSSPLSVYIWLVRMEPFTTLHIKVQSGKFDHPSRLFQSVKGAYDLSSTIIGDYRELIPEFFFDPTFLLNTNAFDLGKIDGRPLSDAILPRWCSNAIEFIYLHRKALESEHVSANVSNWIDLIWGFKQTGQEAIDADNVFYPYLYEDVWNLPHVQQLGNYDEVQATLENLGQIPQKLFEERHPSREPAREPIVSKATPLDVPLQDIVSVFWAEKTLICCTKNWVYSIKISHKKGGAVTPSVTKWKPKLPEWKTASIVSDKNVIFLLANDGVLSVTPTGADQIPVYQELGKIWCISGHREFIIAGGKDASINLYRSRAPFDLLQSFPSFHDEIICCDINSSFDLAVACTKDKNLFFISPSRETVNRVVPLEDRTPLMILITPGWGFVVVYEEERSASKTSRFIELFTVNGERIRIVDINFRIDTWTCWKSTSGFDYLMILCKNRELRACEVFYLDFVDVDRRIDSVQSICYSPIHEVAFVAQSSHITMLPYQFAKSDM